MKDFFERIITLRNHLNLTGEEFSRRIKVSPGYLSKVESGKNTFSRKVVNRIMTEFGANRVWLEVGEGQMMEDPSARRIDQMEREVLPEGPKNAEGEEDQNNYLEGGEVRISRLLKDAEKLLRSKTPFGRALATNIDAFMLGYDSWKDDDPQKKGRGGDP